MSSTPDASPETMPREDLAQLQLERLQATLHRVYRSVAFYRQAFDAAGFDPDDCRSLADLGRLPMTTREQIADHHPYGLFAVPLREVVRLHAATGPAGRPVVVGSTVRDIRVGGELVARALAAAGVTRDDVVQVAFGYGLSPNGPGFQYGAERLGASVVPTAEARADRQIGIMRDYRSTVLVASPSAALDLVEYLGTAGIDPKSLFLRVGVFGAEPFPRELRATLEEGLLLRAADCYCLSELFGPGVAAGCGAGAGLHLAEDHLLAEVVDPATGDPRGTGEEGELVLTTLTREAFPLVRYRTGDLTRIEAGACPCGRTHARIAPIAGRTDDLVSVRGVHFYPAQVGAILAAVEGMPPRFEIALQREGGEDRLEVRVEITERTFFDAMRRQRLLLAEAERRLTEELRLPARVRLVEARSLGTAGGGPRVVDERRR